MHSLLHEAGSATFCLLLRQLLLLLLPPGMLPFTVSALTTAPSWV
jgi:hypothetical protein